MQTLVATVAMCLNFIAGSAAIGFGIATNHALALVMGVLAYIAAIWLGYKLIAV